MQNQQLNFLSIGIASGFWSLTRAGENRPEQGAYSTFFGGKGE
jgi:hypothetical protein